MKYAKLFIGIIFGFAVLLSLLGPVHDKTHGFRLMPSEGKHSVSAVYFSTFRDPIITSYGLFRVREWQNNNKLVLTIKMPKNTVLKAVQLDTTGSGLTEGSVIDLLKEEPVIKLSEDTRLVLVEIKRNHLTIPFSDQIIVIKYESCHEGQCKQFENSQKIKYTYKTQFHFHRLTSLIYAN